jgi:hypothetical protein
VPLLFSALPAQPAATLFGTNKLSSIVGTTLAAWRYSRLVTMPWAPVLPAAIAAFLFSFLGAVSVAWLPRELIRPLVLTLLIAVAIYTFARKDFGRIDQARRHGRRDALVGVAIGAGLGFYDGFFGPGTGSFLIFLFIRFFGLDFLRASAGAKVVNVATNLAALAWFVPSGHVLIGLGLAMGACNLTGSLLGSQLAVRRGAGFVRYVFLVVVGALILKFAWDTFAGA